MNECGESGHGHESAPRSSGVIKSIQHVSFSGSTLGTHSESPNLARDQMHASERERVREQELVLHSEQS